MLYNPKCVFKLDPQNFGRVMTLFGLIFLLLCYVCLFVCVEVLRPSQPNGVMSSAVNLPNHTFTGQA